MKKTILSLSLFFLGMLSQAQTADEIINKYYENTGGREKHEKLQGTKSIVKIKFGTFELPAEEVKLKDGKSWSKATFQGMSMYQNVYDGTTLWSTNQMTMKAEKADSETLENFKNNESISFPDSFLNYKKNGFTVEFMGKEKVEGTEYFKIKLNKKPKKQDGKELANVSFYYFDMENYVPIVIEEEITSGPAAGKKVQVFLGDYQEVEGITFPFSIDNKVDGQTQMSIKIEKMELNPKIEDTIFKFVE
jgi:outer membrane lipoprotein-sorting protein